MEEGLEGVEEGGERAEEGEERCRYFCGDGLRGRHGGCGGKTQRTTSAKAHGRDEATRATQPLPRSGFVTLLRNYAYYVYTIVTAGACISSLIQANITDIKKNVLTFLLGRSVGCSFREHHHAISQMV